MDWPTLLIGDVEYLEFEPAANALIEAGAVCARDARAALDLIADGLSPAVIVVAQCWPSQFSRRDLNRLRRAAPLARFVGLLGPWLEGETRTGKPWPTMQRSYWHQAAVRLASEPSESHFPQWSLAVTAGDDERLLLDTLKSSSAGHDRRRVIAICARHRETAESLADICRMQKWNSIWLRELPTETPLEVDALIVDNPKGVGAEVNNITRLRTLVGDAPILVLLGFPQQEIVDQLLSAGATAVVAKPSLTSDLIPQIERSLALGSVG